MSPAFSSIAEFTGPIFDSPFVHGVIHDMFGDALKDAAKQGQELVRGELTEGHGVRTGRFRDSIVGEVVKGRGGRYGVVHSPEKQDSRRLRTWLERGTRRGVRLRKGYRMFARSKTKLRAQERAIAARHAGAAVRKIR